MPSVTEQREVIKTQSTQQLHNNQVKHFQPYVWGNHTIDDLSQITSAVYDEIVFWKKNLFLLPSGQAGKSFIREMTRLIEIWNNDAILKEISLKLLMIMPALLLLKSNYKSKS